MKLQMETLYVNLKPGSQFALICDVLGVFKYSCQ